MCVPEKKFKCKVFNDVECSLGEAALYISELYLVRAVY